MGQPKLEYLKLGRLQDVLTLIQILGLPLEDWLVDVTYGRIGSPGRTIRHVAADELEARRIVRLCLQRRGTACKRIGVDYRLRELSDPGHWLMT